MSNRSVAKKPVVPCSIAECIRPACGPSGMCSACQGWWRYHKYQSVTQVTRYLWRVQLAGSRVGRFGLGSGAGAVPDKKKSR